MKRRQKYCKTLTFSLFWMNFYFLRNKILYYFISNFSTKLHNYFFPKFNIELLNRADYLISIKISAKMATARSKEKLRKTKEYAEHAEQSEIT